MSLMNFGFSRVRDSSASAASADTEPPRKLRRCNSNKVVAAKANTDDATQCNATPAAETMDGGVDLEISTSIAHEAAKFPQVRRNREQFEAWRRTRNWLTFDDVSCSVKCMTCSQVKQLGLHAAPGQHYESAFVDGTVKVKDAKALLKKIDKHRDSGCHTTCEKILVNRDKSRLKRLSKTLKQGLWSTTKITLRPLKKYLERHMSVRSHICHSPSMHVY